jgi:predicted alpha/beta hydrolase family esterase
MFERYVLNNYIFNATRSNKQIDYPKTPLSGIEYLLIERFSWDWETSKKEELKLKVLYCYGNQSCLADSTRFFTVLCDVLLKLYENYKVQLVGIVWEYPTYGNATLSDVYLDPGLFLSLGKEIYTYLKYNFKPSSDDKVVVIGHSLGTAVASFLSTLTDTPSAVLLLNPFSTLPGGTTYTLGSYLVNPIFNNVEVLKESKCRVIGMFSENDEVLPLERNFNSLHQVLDETYVVPKATHLSVLQDFEVMLQAVTKLASFIVTPGNTPKPQVMYEDKHLTESGVVQEPIVKDTSALMAANIRHLELD